MNLADQYFRNVSAQLQCVSQTQSHAIESAADAFHQSLLGDGWIYLFGTGHSHMLAEELFYRAGGLARIIPMLHEPLMLHSSASESSNQERNPNIVSELLEKYPLAPADTLVVASNSGRNAVPVELAVQAGGLGLRTIAIVNLNHSRAWPSRHPDGTNLADVCDVVIDNCGVPGDACVKPQAHDIHIGAASTITGCMILQMIACRTVEKQFAIGRIPEIYQSSNSAAGDKNHHIIAKYRESIPHL